MLARQRRVVRAHELVNLLQVLPLLDQLHPSARSYDQLPAAEVVMNERLTEEEGDGAEVMPDVLGSL